MNATRKTGRLAPPTLALGLVLAAFAGGSRATAQEPAAPAAEEGSGRPLDGYLATGFLVGAAMFAVGKTARR